MRTEEEFLKLENDLLLKDKEIETLNFIQRERERGVDVFHYHNFSTPIQQCRPHSHTTYLPEYFSCATSPHRGF